MDHGTPEIGDEPFDFEKHGQDAVAEYLPKREFYSDLAQTVERILKECLKGRDIKIHSVNSRAKDPDSFKTKAASRSDHDPSVPKYQDPVRQITDLAGVRVITFFQKTLSEIDDVVNQEFEVVSRSDKGATLLEEERFGYLSIHYDVKLNQQRAQLPEHRAFADSIVEIQVRTILQHAWAEIEHDIQYKSTLVIPAEIKRRFMALAGLFELADREFQSIQDADVIISEQARASVQQGNLDVEITPVALRLYLDRRLGSDGRISALSYDFDARMLRRLGFSTLAQVEECIAPFNDDSVSRAATGARQGQTTRFELMLLAGMGEKFIDRHPWGSEPWWDVHQAQNLQRLRDAGVTVGSYDPPQSPYTT